MTLQRRQDALPGQGINIQRSSSVRDSERDGARLRRLRLTVSCCIVVDAMKPIEMF